MLLNKWNIKFDVWSTSVEILLVWVHIPGLPLIRWSKEVFEKIGNTLGTFYEVDLSFQETRYYGMARILVGLEVSKGLVVSMYIIREVDLLYLNLDFEGIPFRCVHFHYYGNLDAKWNYPSMWRN
jgi:hypothetical protein